MTKFGRRSSVELASTSPQNARRANGQFVLVVESTLKLLKKSDIKKYVFLSVMTWRFFVNLPLAREWSGMLTKLRGKECAGARLQLNHEV